MASVKSPILKKPYPTSDPTLVGFHPVICFHELTINTTGTCISASLSSTVLSQKNVIVYTFGHRESPHSDNCL